MAFPIERKLETLNVFGGVNLMRDFTMQLVFDVKKLYTPKVQPTTYPVVYKFRIEQKVLIFSNEIHQKESDFGSISES